MNQKGFATLEIILMVMVVGILATIAVPQFEKLQRPPIPQKFNQI